MSLLHIFCRHLLVCVIFLGSTSASEQPCGGCHLAEVEAWRQSHHAAAMAIATPDTVLGSPDIAITDQLGTRYTLQRDGQKYAVRIKEADGDQQRFALKYTFGIEPLQQYLVDIGGGRLQALPVAFDTRPQTAGGQRWFALDTDLHWRSFGFNWNTSCADCHSTGLERNYDPERDQFNTTWSEINVACAACHQGVDGHLAWLESKQREQVENVGFKRSLPRRSRWHFQREDPIAKRATDRRDQSQLPMCARCHALRTMLNDGDADPELLNQMSLALLEPGLYHSDGQIQAEVYVTGSYLQSKMHAAGVVCSDCHEPHSLKLRAEGNGVCAQCHRADHFAQTAHHGHSSDGVGGQCVNCHMPATTYMVVDPRRDHRFGTPDPALTEKFGIPNACADCHAARGDQWIAKQFKTLFPKFQRDPYAHAIAAFDAGATSARHSLQALVANPDLAPIKRASAQLRLGPLNPALDSVLDAHSSLLRLATLRSLQGHSLDGRLVALWPLLQDPVLAVRLEAIRLLEPLLGNQPGAPALSQGQRNTLSEAVAFRRKQLQRNADHPAVQMDLGVSYERTGDRLTAGLAYAQALRIEPDYVPAMLNLAELQRRDGDDAAAARLLERAVTVAPDSADAQFAMALQLIRQQAYPAALERLEQAATLAPGNLRYIYTLAVAQEQTGDIRGAIATLRAALGTHAESPILLRLITQYSLRAGRVDAARRYLQRWRAAAPGDPAIAPVERALQQPR